MSVIALRGLNANELLKVYSNALSVNNIKLSEKAVNVIGEKVTNKWAFICSNIIFNT